MSYKINDQTLPPNERQSARVAFENHKVYDKAISNPQLAEAYDFSKLENGLYTKTDLKRDFVQPKKNRLQLVTENKQKQIFLIDFVADAFQDFRVFLKNKKFKKLADDPIIKKDWKAEIGHEDIDIFLDKRMNDVYQSFASNYLIPSGKDKEIKNFDDFLKVFMNDYYRKMQSPLTKTGFIQSSRVGPHFSGLCVQVSVEDSKGYSNKYNKFVNSKNFETFSLAAAQFGFMLDYHVPWRLIANLNSPKLYPYILDRVQIINPNATTQGTFGNAAADHFHTYNLDENLNGYTSDVQYDGQVNVPNHIHEIKNGQLMQSQHFIKGTGGILFSDDPQYRNTAHIHNLSLADNSFLKVSDVYDVYFYRTSYIDIETLKYYLIDMYNTFVSSNPATVVSSVCMNGNFVTIMHGQKNNISTVTRDFVDYKTVSEMYNDVFWYKLYFNIRLKEVGAKISNAHVTSAIKKMEDYYFSVDNLRAMRYINDYLKQYY